jgi:hypothetical protein
MGVDLIGYEEKSLSYAMWDGCLELAVAFGWKPAGTTAPFYCHEGHPWSGTYSSSDGQGVSDKDARAISEALYRALTALKPKQKLTAGQRRAWSNKHVGVDSVCRFAEYAAKGRFEIL